MLPFNCNVVYNSSTATIKITCVEDHYTSNTPYAWTCKLMWVLLQSAEMKHERVLANYKYIPYPSVKPFWYKQLAL